MTDSDPAKLQQEKAATDHLTGCSLCIIMLLFHCAEAIHLARIITMELRHCQSRV